MKNWEMLHGNAYVADRNKICAASRPICDFICKKTQTKNQGQQNNIFGISALATGWLLKLPQKNSELIFSRCYIINKKLKCCKHAVWTNTAVQVENSLMFQVQEKPNDFFTLQTLVWFTQRISIFTCFVTMYKTKKYYNELFVWRTESQLSIFIRPEAPLHFVLWCLTQKRQYNNMQFDFVHACKVNFFGKVLHELMY